ncbi:hypothetical protein [Deinococcus aestuarii]|uniref:hypothetical protein n=1 Tax=Deinococcus aestuarii TaxID=2774531 RepID=UPI001C0C9DA8|nr:hypothetical protein [Deinococcus aestuarii]
MTDYKSRELNDPSDIDLQDTIDEGMQGASGDMNANGLEGGADSEQKLEELGENLQGLTGAGGGALPGPSDTE